MREAKLKSLQPPLFLRQQDHAQGGALFKPALHLRFHHQVLRCRMRDADQGHGRFRDVLHHLGEALFAVGVVNVAMDFSCDVRLRPQRPPA